MGNLKKIVVIDDEKDLAVLIAEVLEETGRYQVFCTFDGQSGCDLCLKEKPDLIFVDYVMPKMKGTEVIKFLHTVPQTRQTPIILMSGFSEDILLPQASGVGPTPSDAVLFSSGAEAKLPKGIGHYCQEMGIYGFLGKPFLREDLLELVSKVFAKTKFNKQ